MKKLLFISSFFFAILMTMVLTPIVGAVTADIVGLGIASLNFLPIEKGILGLNNSNNTSARDSYKIAKDLFYNGLRNLFPMGSPDENLKGDRMCREFVNSRKLSQSEIRLEVELTATSNTFTFGLTANQQNSTGVIFNTENRLTMQDSLVCSEYGIYIGAPSSRIDTTWQLKTYGSQPTFSAASALVLDSTFYSHGYFRVTANNDVVMPYRGLFNHWYRGQTQQTAAFGAGSPFDQIRGAEDGQITCEPNILLIGSKGYLPQIVLPTNLTGMTETFNRAVIIFRGVLAQNSTSVS